MAPFTHSEPVDVVITRKRADINRDARVACTTMRQRSLSGLFKPSEDVHHRSVTQRTEQVRAKFDHFFMRAHF